MEQVKRIKELLIALGITPEIKGYLYLVYAINDVADIYSLGKTNVAFIQLYKDIADIFNDTPARVERAMRWAVTNAFKKPSKMLRNIFTFICDEGAAKVSISRFVCTVAQYSNYEK